MLLIPYRRKHDVWLTACNRVDQVTAQSGELATARAAAAMRNGRLLSSLEAKLMAGPEARSRETLYSIAHATALDSGGDEEEILAILERRFKGLS